MIEENVNTGNATSRSPEEIEMQVANILGEVDDAPIDDQSTEESTEEFDMNQSEGNDSTSHTQQQEQQLDQEQVPSYNPVWDVLKKKLSTEENPYELPEHIVKRKKPDGSELTTEEEFEELVSHIVANVEIDEPDPFVAKYKAEKTKENFSLEEFIKQYHQETNVFSLPSKDYLFNKMKHQVANKKADWTDQEITEYLESKNKVELDLMANQAKEADKIALSRAAKANQQQYEVESKNKRQEAINNLNTQISSQANLLLKDMMNESSIGGIPHGQADIDEFAPYFNELVSINPATGKPKLNELLNNDKTLYRALYMLYKADKGAITDFKESYKQDVLNKTGLGKRTEGGTQRTVRVPKPEDFVS